ncbi:hypothetical protein AA313_de0201658 [Arthrobotrys entomopaga]|nr:hypothetical protein AA313_de0201658 [Arthrobotrys entomopaga]
MCHQIYTFQGCPHIDISDDTSHFPPCACSKVHASHRLSRSCNACIRFSSPSFRKQHKKMVEMQIGRFRALKLSLSEIEKLVPQWKIIVGLGVKVARDWADSDDEVDTDHHDRDKDDEDEGDDDGGIGGKSGEVSVVETTVETVVDTDIETVIKT